MSRPITLAALALLAAAAGCADRADSGPTAPPEAPAPIAAADLKARSERAGRAAEERLARRMAMALADPGFRTALKLSLDGSRVREHKLHFQRLLRAPGRPDPEGHGEGRP